jgi:hypothetical protein
MMGLVNMSWSALFHPGEKGGIVLFICGYLKYFWNFGQEGQG